MRVAAIQMASGSIISGNLLEAEKIIGKAVEDGAEMVVLPENFGMIGIIVGGTFKRRKINYRCF